MYLCVCGMHFTCRCSTTIPASVLSGNGHLQLCSRDHAVGGGTLASCTHSHAQSPGPCLGPRIQVLLSPICPPWTIKIWKVIWFPSPCHNPEARTGVRCAMGEILQTCSLCLPPLPWAHQPSTPWNCCVGERTGQRARVKVTVALQILEEVVASYNPVLPQNSATFLCPGRILRRAEGGGQSLLQYFNRGRCG